MLSLIVCDSVWGFLGWKRICAGFVFYLLFIYICIVDGNPIITEGSFGIPLIGFTPPYVVPVLSVLLRLVHYIITSLVSSNFYYVKLFFKKKTYCGCKSILSQCSCFLLHSSAHCLLLIIQLMSFMPPRQRVGGHINLPLSVRSSVRPDIDTWFVRLFLPTVLELQL